jgi:hypothetical protein
MRWLDDIVRSEINNRVLFLGRLARTVKSPKDEQKRRDKSQQRGPNRLTCDCIDAETSLRQATSDVLFQTLYKNTKDLSGLQQDGTVNLKNGLYEALCCNAMTALDTAVPGMPGYKWSLQSSYHKRREMRS